MTDWWRVSHGHSLWHWRGEDFDRVLRCVDERPRLDDKFIVLLVIDELFLRKLPASAGDEFADVLMSRYEKRSTIVTSNRPVEDWAKLLCDVVVVTPLLDRLMHHAHLLSSMGKVGGSKKPPCELRSTPSACNHPAVPPPQGVRQFWAR